MAKASSKGAAAKGNSKSSFVSRQAKAKKALTEAELLRRGDMITPEDVLNLEAATESKCVVYNDKFSNACYVAHMQGVVLVSFYQLLLCSCVHFPH